MKSSDYITRGCKCIKRLSTGTHIHQLLWLCRGKGAKKETVKGVDSKRLGRIVTWLKGTCFQAEAVVPNTDEKVYTIGNMEYIRNPYQSCFARDTGADGSV